MNAENFHLEANWLSPVFFGDLALRVADSLGQQGWTWKTDANGGVVLDFHEPGIWSKLAFEKFTKSPDLFVGSAILTVQSPGGARLSLASTEDWRAGVNNRHLVARMTVGFPSDLGWVPSLIDSSNFRRTKEVYEALKLLATVLGVGSLFLMRRPRYYDEEAVDYRFCLFYFSSMGSPGRQIKYLEEERLPSWEVIGIRERGRCWQRSLDSDCRMTAIYSIDLQKGYMTSVAIPPI